PRRTPIRAVPRTAGRAGPRCSARRARTSRVRLPGSGRSSSAQPSRKGVRPTEQFFPSGFTDGSDIGCASKARPELPLIAHLSIRVRNGGRAKRFYDAALAPLGYKCLGESAGSLGYGDAAVTLWISVVDRPVSSDAGSGLHFCFAAPTRQSVDAFHAAAL